MEEFPVRLTNVIHWIGFLSPFVFMTTINAPFRWTVGISLSLAAFVGGWVLKYVLTGRKGFFPWMAK